MRTIVLPARDHGSRVNGVGRADVSREAVHALHGVSLLAHGRRAADAVRAAPLASRAVDDRRHRDGSGFGRGGRSARRAGIPVWRTGRRARARAPRARDASVPFAHRLSRWAPGHEPPDESRSHWRRAEERMDRIRHGRPRAAEFRRAGRPHAARCRVHLLRALDFVSDRRGLRDSRRTIPARLRRAVCRSHGVHAHAISISIATIRSTASRSATRSAPRWSR